MGPPGRPMCWIVRAGPARCRSGRGIWRGGAYAGDEAVRAGLTTGQSQRQSYRTLIPNLDPTHLPSRSSLVQCPILSYLTLVSHEASLIVWGHKGLWWHPGLPQHCAQDHRGHVSHCLASTHLDCEHVVGCDLDRPREGQGEVHGRWLCLLPPGSRGWAMLPG